MWGEEACAGLQGQQEAWCRWGRQNTDIYRWTTRTGREETHGVEKPKFMVFVNGRFRGCAGWTLEKGGQW
jgi:hypothetical protein